MTKVRMKRVYEEPELKDGYRILVDRLWPRGVKKENLSYDLWAKNIAPSPNIRKEFNHESEKFPQFKKNYLFELTENEEAGHFIDVVSMELKERDVTLLYAAKDPEINHVVILKEWLEKSM